MGLQCISRSNNNHLLRLLNQWSTRLFDIIPSVNNANERNKGHTVHKLHQFAFHAKGRNVFMREFIIRAMEVRLDVNGGDSSNIRDHFTK